MGVKAIIAGGRDYQFSPEDEEWLNSIDDEFEIIEVVHGNCKGADACGMLWAISRGIPVTAFKVTPEEWKTIGPGAGPLRNKRMAQYLSNTSENGICILFPGGKGTINMHNQAVKHKLVVLKREDDEGIFGNN